MIVERARPLTPHRNLFISFYHSICKWLADVKHFALEQWKRNSFRPKRTVAIETLFRFWEIIVPSSLGQWLNGSMAQSYRDIYFLSLSNLDRNAHTKSKRPRANTIHHRLADWLPDSPTNPKACQSRRGMTSNVDRTSNNIESRIDESQPHTTRKQLIMPAAYTSFCVCFLLRPLLLFVARSRGPGLW